MNITGLRGESEQTYPSPSGAPLARDGVGLARLDPADIGSPGRGRTKSSGPYPPPSTYGPITSTDNNRKGLYLPWLTRPSLDVMATIRNGPVPGSKGAQLVPLFLVSIS